MYTAVSKSSLDFSNAMRWCARAPGAFLMVCWVALFIIEIMRQRLSTHPKLIRTYGQPVALAVVFAGYVIGWWKEFAGGALAIVGTFAFFALLAAKSKTPPEPAAVWFAAPGILYLLAFQYNERRNKRLARQS